ncbi:MAG: hypothetical protein R2709_10240 [Marmoricola sp.]
MAPVHVISGNEPIVKMRATSERAKLVLGTERAINGAAAVRAPRSAIAGVLVIIAGLLPVILLARFITHDVADTDRYLATVKPLAKSR